MDLWRLVSRGKDVISEIPGDRGWDITNQYDPNPGTPGKFYVKRGGFLHNAYEFDANFFQMSPREARASDPQQRLALETAWESIEHAGINPLSLSGSPTGVFVGCSYNSYAAVPLAAMPEALHGYWGTGYSPSMSSGRIAYALGSAGPAMTIDTGCSSSLVALHLACQSLSHRECDLALAGGVTVMASPESLIYFSQQRALAPDGRSKAFAAGADGVGFAEGTAMLVMERLADARRRRHRVLAVIKGTAVNQDGATSSGLTAPGVRAQREVIRTALQRAGLAPADVDAVEAHGTGTTVGDPIEANALIDTYGRGRRRDEPLWIGSVKSNIGHTQSAAGAAGVIKMVLAMGHGELPRTLHVDSPTPRVDWNRGAVSLLTQAVAWPERGHPFRAGVSAFGISGTNAHVILEAPTPAVRRRTAAVRRGSVVPVPVLLSAKTAPALREQARRLAGHPACRAAGVDLADVGHALATTRGLFEHRAVILARGRAELRSRLLALAKGEDALGVVSGQARQKGKVAFVFPGQGGQWPGMAADLLAESPVFGRHLADCADALAPHVDWSPPRVLREGLDQAALDRVDIIQPVLFAIAASLAALWRSMGVEPDAVVGHSQGEIAAAYACGALSLDDAARIVALRSQALRPLAGTGMMALVPLSATAIRRLACWDESIEIAAENSPSATIVAADSVRMSRFRRDLAAAGTGTTAIAVNYASHSAQVECVRHDLARSLAGVAARSSSVRFYSTVTGELTDTRRLDAAYWWDNLRMPVRFADAVRALTEDGICTLIEVSPHPVLAPAIQETRDDMLPQAEAATVIGTLRRGQGGQTQFLTEVAKAHAAGVPVRWDALFEGRAGRHVELPTYPFQHDRFCLPAPASRALPATPRADEPEAARLSADGDLLRLDWPVIPGLPAQAPLPEMAIIGPDRMAIASTLRDHGHRARCYRTLSALKAAVRAGATAPDVVLAPVTCRDHTAEPASGARATAERALRALREWLGEEGLSATRLVILTRQAIACDAGDEPADLPSATAWGLMRSAQAENPGRITVVDLDDHDASVRAIPAAISVGEPQAAIRNGALRVPRVVPAAPAGLTPPGTPAWHLAMESPGNLDTLALMPLPDAARPLAAGEVQVAVRAAGLCHRDALATLGRYPKAAGVIGCEIAGVVTETGRDVTSVKAGDRVMGLAEGGIGPVAVTDYRYLTRVPDHWSFAEAATVPVAFLTAYYRLRYSARVQPGQKPFIGTVSAGTPMAATQLVARLRAEVLPPGSLGRRPSEADVVLDWLDLADLPPEQVSAMLAELSGMFSRAELSPLPFRAWDVRLAREAFRLLWTGQAGKIVLTMPTRPDPHGTFLITGGTGVLGGSLALHLIREYGARRLLLISRRGDRAPGARELARDLRAAGAEVKVAACDVTDPHALRRVIDEIPAEHPLTYVAHAAGALADATIARMSRERLRAALAPKVDGAWNLYQATRHADLSALVLFSSVAATWGLPGQGNYAAANAFLDSLAADLRARGVPASALGWGIWAVRSGLADVSPADEARLSRSEGLLPLGHRHALGLHDLAIRGCEAHLLPARLSLAALRSQAAGGLLRPLLRALVPDGEATDGAHPAAGSGRGTPGRGLDDARPRLDSAKAVLDLVVAQTALVLGHPTADAIDVQRSFRELGIDSLASLELSQRLSAKTGVSLPKGVTSDYPAPADLAAMLHGRLPASAPAGT